MLKECLSFRRKPESSEFVSPFPAPSRIKGEGCFSYPLPLSLPRQDVSWGERARMRGVILVVFTLAPSACSFIPEYTRPDLPVPNQFPQYGGERVTSATEIGWREFFSDPRLQSLIGQSLE